MSWTDAAKYALLMLLAGFIASGVSGDIQRRALAAKLKMAEVAMELAKAHAEMHATHERMPWDDRA